MTGNVEALRFEDNSFDLVYASLALHHWENKKQGISEAYRVLKSGGNLIIGDPLLKGWMSNRLLGWLTQKLDGGVFATPRELTDYLEGAGFTHVHIDLVPHSMRSLFLVTATKP